MYFTRKLANEPLFDMNMINVHWQMKADDEINPAASDVDEQMLGSA